MPRLPVQPRKTDLLYMGNAKGRLTTPGGIRTMDSTHVRQIGDVSRTRRMIFAHSQHMHMCRQGNTAVSFGSTMHITHSFPKFGSWSAPDSAGTLRLSRPYISCSS
jgi:hypothetical protein